jgi:hypothetical protein
VNSKPAASVQVKILAQLLEVAAKVDESLMLSKENGNQLKLLRTELGLDSQHGRLPIVEATLIRHETRMEKTEQRLNTLEIEEHEASGRDKFKATAFAILGGSAGAAVIAIIAHMLGLK